MKKPVERQTLSRLIAAGKTHAEKWKIALHGGKLPTPIERLTQEVFSLREFLSDPKPPATHAELFPKWKEDSKRRFANLLFPALLEDKPDVLNELLEAMACERRKRRGQIKLLGKKKQAGQRLRLALLSLDPDELQSMKTVLDTFDSRSVDYSDESHVRRVMREADVHLLRPGQRFVWLDYTRRFVLRELHVSKDGKVSIKPQTFDYKGPIICMELVRDSEQPGGPQRPDK